LKDATQPFAEPKVIVINLCQAEHVFLVKEGSFTHKNILNQKA